MSHESFPASEKEQIPSLDATIDVKAKYFDRHPEDIRPDDLNNFHLWLPGSRYIQQVEKYLKPADLERNTAIEETIKELPDTRRTLEEYVERQNAVEQELADIGKKLIATQKEIQEKYPFQEDEPQRSAFYRELDPLRQRQEELRAEKSKAPRILNETLIPLYLAMRAKGFSHYDLVR